MMLQIWHDIISETLHSRRSVKCKGRNVMRKGGSVNRTTGPGFYCFSKRELSQNAPQFVVLSLLQTAVLPYFCFKHRFNIKNGNAHLTLSDIQWQL